MLDPKVLRDNPEAVAEQLAKKGFVLDLAQFNALESERKRLQSDLESLQNQRNQKSKAIGQAKASGEDAAPILAEVGAIGARLDAVKVEYAALSDRYQALVAGLPNLPDASVPSGGSEADNQELHRFGTLPEFNSEPLDHVDLGARLGMDMEAAARIAGSRFVVLRGQLARLHRALTQFMLDIHTAEHGYEEVYVPYVVNAESLFGTGQLPKFEADLFRLQTEQPFYLAPTAEVPVTNLMRDSITAETELPLRFVCHSPCFRSEAGSYGKDTRGMIRQHQFDKVELVQVVHPDASWEALEQLTRHAEQILERLELPYRRVVLCGGDLGFASAKTYDLEVWLPGQQAYREISSCSNFLDFQARRLLARYRPAGGGKPELVHTLNGSALAVGRTLVAVLENYQEGAGGVQVPDALRPYLGGLQRLAPEDG